MADCRQDTNGRFGGAAPAIHVRNARLRLGTTILFENLSIDVAPGEITCQHDDKYRTDTDHLHLSQDVIKVTGLSSQTGHSAI